MLSKATTLHDTPVSTFVFHFSSRFVSLFDHNRQSWFEATIPDGFRLSTFDRLDSVVYTSERVL
jgi:hypothetical protein